jgi:hypothetical protein
MHVYAKLETLAYLPDDEKRNYLMSHLERHISRTECKLPVSDKRSFLTRNVGLLLEVEWPKIYR